MHPIRGYLYSFFAATLVFSIFFFEPHLPRQYPTECDDCFLSEAEKFMVNYRRCLREKLENEIKLWKRLPSTIRFCLALQDFSKAFKVVRIGSPNMRNTSKFGILPASKRSPCVAVLVRHKYFSGRGSGEQELHRLTSKCQFHVADPNPDRWWVTRGKFYNKEINFANVGDATWNRHFASQEIDMHNVKVALKTFLENEVNVSRIDYLWIDNVNRYIFKYKKAYYIDHEISFPEYSILEEPFNVTVCQLSLYVPFFDVRNKIDQMESARPHLQNKILSAISNSPFLPIHSEFLKKQGVLRTTYMNMSSPYCLKKFLDPAFCAYFQCSDEKLEGEWKKFQDMIGKFEKDLLKIEKKFRIFSEE